MVIRIFGVPLISAHGSGVAVNVLLGVQEISASKLFPDVAAFPSKFLLFCFFLFSL
jgi:hypothetical protein